MSNKDIADAKVPPIASYEHTCLPLTVRHTGRRAAAGRGGGGLGAAIAGRGGGLAAGGGERGGGEVRMACGGGFGPAEAGGLRTPPAPDG